MDGTRQAARQRALPQTETLPLPHRRFDQVCAPGYQGRKRGEVVRTRTVILQAHTHQFLGTFGAAGNGDYRGELRRAIEVITSYATHLGLSPASMLVRLDGLYGDAAPLMDVLSAGLGVVARSRAYPLLDLEVVKQALMRAPDQVSTHPESRMTRTLYECPTIPLTPPGPEVRMVIARRVGISARQHLRQPMDLPNGPVPPLLMAFLVLRSHSNQMGRCVVLPIIPSILKSGIPNAMAPCGCCMPRALAIAAPVLCEPSVKRVVRRSSRDG